jgi:hypothetical protein
MKKSCCREDKDVVFILMFSADSNLNREDIHRYGSCQCMNQCHALFKERKPQSQNSRLIFIGQEQICLQASSCLIQIKIRDV